jgi:hypothetical protein
MTRVCGLTSILLALAIALAGCLDVADDAALSPSAPPALTSGPKRRAPRARTAARRAAARVGLSIKRMAQTTALEVTGAPPARAYDPVLRVGDRVLRRYVHAGPGVLRFVADEPLPAGAPVTLEYGDHATRLGATP